MKPDKLDRERRTVMAALLGAVGGGALAGCARPPDDATGVAALRSALVTTADAVAHVETSIGASTLSLANSDPSIFGTTVVIAEGALFPGDGGGGIFVWRQGSAVPDNRGIVIQPTSMKGPGRWHRVYDGPVYVDWFGIDGSPTANHAPAFAAACSWLVGSGGIVALGARTYTLRSVVEVPPWVGLRGAGRQATQIAMYGSAQLKWAGSGAATHLGGSLRDVWLYSRGTEGTVNALVSLSSVALFSMSDCRLDGRYEGESASSRVGVEIVGAMDLSFSSITINGCIEAAARIDAASQTTTVQFARCAFRATERGPGVDVSGLAIHFDNCTFESNGLVKNFPYRVEHGVGVLIRRGSVSVHGGYFENNRGHDLYAGFLPGTAPLSAPESAHVTVMNPVFQPGPLYINTNYRVVLDAVASGAILGGNYATFTRTILLKARAQGALISGIAATSNIDREGPLEAYGGLIERADTASDFELNGKSSLRIAGLTVVRS